MLWLWTLLAALAGLAGIRHLVRLRAGTPPAGTPRVDDAAVRRILETGSLPTEDDRLDMREAARAEEEFWNETWDEPEEYQR